MNEIVKKQWTPPAADGWNAIADEAEKPLIQGQLLKFNEGRWLLGKEAVQINEGRQFEARAAAVAWTKWQGGNPVEYRERTPNGFLPKREELGDNDPADWEFGPDGQRRDPWRLTFFVYLEDPNTAEVVTFSTASWGGRNCVETLADQTKRMREKHPDVVPVVELCSAPMKTRFGLKSKPVLKVVRWLEMMPPDDILPPQKPPPEVPSLTAGQELDDEIPF